jgi:hypothetical protein
MGGDFKHLLFFRRFRQEGNFVWTNISSTEYLSQ